MPAAWLTLVSLLLAMVDGGVVAGEPLGQSLDRFLIASSTVEERDLGRGKSGRDESAGSQHEGMSHRVNQGVLRGRDAKQVRRRDGEEEGEEEEKGRLGKIIADKPWNGWCHGIYGGWDSELGVFLAPAPPKLPYMTNVWY